MHKLGTRRSDESERKEIVPNEDNLLKGDAHQDRHSTYLN